MGRDGKGISVHAAACGEFVLEIAGSYGLEALVPQGFEQRRDGLHHFGRRPGSGRAFKDGWPFHEVERVCAPVCGVVIGLAVHAHRPDGQSLAVVLEAESILESAQDPRGGDGVYVDRGVIIG